MFIKPTKKKKEFGSFDFDGTLVKLGRLRKNFMRAMEIVGMPVETLDRYIAMVRKGARLPVDLYYTPILLDPDLARDKTRHELFINTFHSLELRTPYESVEGAHAVLEKFDAAGVKKVIWSANRLITMVDKMKSAGFLFSSFAYVITNDGPYVKPHPRAILPILDELGLEPSDGFHVGDSLTDIEGGRASGLEFFGVLTGMLDRDGFHEHDVDDDHILDSVADLPLVIEI